jgi:Family of unknown function (DUF5681)
MAGAKTPRPLAKGMKAPWPPGVSGNPRGRPQGSRHRVTVALENLFDREGEVLSRRCIELAKDGDLQALRLCLERVLPTRKDRPVRFPLPPIASAAEAAQASAMILAAVGAGELTPAEGVEISKLVETYIKAAELSELERRVERLEGKQVSLLEP